MGASRKVQHFPGVNARNLKKNDLGGVIFGCTHGTMNECLQNQIFGLPSSHISYVQNIQPGLPLFLFNYSNKKLYGIFEAASHGQMDINPSAWTADGLSRTSYPAQVRMRIRKQCQPLSEEQFKKIIVANYYNQSHHFWFELDHAQTGALLSSFELFPVMTVLPYNAPMQKIPQVAQHNNDRKDELKNSKSDQKREFMDVIAPDADARDVDENLKASMLEADSTLQEDGDTALGSLSTNSCGNEENEEIQTPECDSDKEDMESEEEIFFLKLKQIALDRETLNIPKDHTEEALTTSETRGVDEFSLAAPSVQDGCEDASINPNSSQSVINLLRHELEELKASGRDQLIKTSALEKQQVSSDIEIQQLRDRVEVLESQLKDSSTFCGEASASYNNEASESYYNEALTDPFNLPQLSMKDLIFVMGGSDANGTRLSTLDCYSTSADIVRSLKPMSSARSYASAALSNGHIFTFGGCGDLTGNLWYDTVEYYNPWNNEWASCSPLSERKGCLASVSLQNKIFAFGGGNGVDISSKVEMFDPALGRWILTESMLQKRFAAAAAELNGLLYVVGGYCDDSYLKSAERFDPREVSWTRLPSMNTSRGSHCLAVLKEKIYALGGFDGTGMVSSVEVFDPRMGSWVVDNEMKHSRGYCFAPVIGDAIYAIGGLREHGTFAETVECYKEGHGWSVAKLKGIGKRSFFSAVIV